MGSTLDILKRLATNDVEFVLVGGMAGIAHGSSIVTEDLDICGPMSRPNIARIIVAIGDLNPCWRMLPNRPPMPLDAAQLQGYKNLYLITDWGQVDFLSEITGLGDYANVRSQAALLDIAGTRCWVLSIDALIRAKRAMGRPKDIQAAVELEAIRANKP